MIADAIHDNPANDDYALETVVDREPISDLFAKIFSMHATHERGLERLTDSPLFASVVASFVNKLVADVIAQNRQIAEKLPGMGSLFSLGMGAASKVKGVSDQLLGDVAGKGAQFALRRTNSAILDVLRTAPVHEAAMQLWDVHADASGRAAARVRRPRRFRRTGRDRLPARRERSQHRVLQDAARRLRGCVLRPLRRAHHRRPAARTRPVHRPSRRGGAALRAGHRRRGRGRRRARAAGAGRGSSRSTTRTACWAFSVLLRSHALDHRMRVSSAHIGGSTHRRRRHRVGWPDHNCRDSRGPDTEVGGLSPVRDRAPRFARS